MAEETSVYIMAVHDRGPTGQPDTARILSWHAVWQGQNPHAPLGEFDGTRDEAIAWARQTGSSNISIYDPRTKDLLPLETSSG